MNPTRPALLGATAVIFDVDGTLVDSVDFHAEAWQRAFAAFGFDFDVVKIRSQIGKGGDQLMPVFLDADILERHGRKIEAFRQDLFEREHFHRVRQRPARTTCRCCCGGCLCLVDTRAGGAAAGRRKRVEELRRRVDSRLRVCRRAAPATSSFCRSRPFCPARKSGRYRAWPSLYPDLPSPMWKAMTRLFLAGGTSMVGAAALKLLLVVSRVAAARWSSTDRGRVGLRRRAPAPVRRSPGRQRAATDDRRAAEEGSAPVSP